MGILGSRLKCSICKKIKTMQDLQWKESSIQDISHGNSSLVISQNMNLWHKYQLESIEIKQIFKEQYFLICSQCINQQSKCFRCLKSYSDLSGNNDQFLMKQMHYQNPPAQMCYKCFKELLKKYEKLRKQHCCQKCGNQYKICECCMGEQQAMMFDYSEKKWHKKIFKQFWPMNDQELIYFSLCFTCYNDYINTGQCDICLKSSKELQQLHHMEVQFICYNPLNKGKPQLGYFSFCSQCNKQGKEKLRADLIANEHDLLQCESCNKQWCACQINIIMNKCPDCQAYVCGNCNLSAINHYGQKLICAQCQQVCRKVPCRSFPDNSQYNVALTYNCTNPNCSLGKSNLQA